MGKAITRRGAIRRAAAGVLILGGGLSARGSPNERLNIACIGVGGRGAVNREGIKSENLVALCDVDEKSAAAGFNENPRAKRYRDFRRMLDEMHREIDAVVISTPDHTHAPAAVLAMQMGKHCYCEKPLSHSVYEARVTAETAAAKKVATQLGTQRHCWDHARHVVSLVQSGVLGPIHECHVWIDGNRGGGERPKDTPPVPSTLDWDLWLGPAPARPYHPVYAPYGWRFWWDFGTGETGNMGCHILDLPFEALALKHPSTIEAEGPPVHLQTSPKWMAVRYEFPARGSLPSLVLHWYHGRKPQSLLAGQDLKPWGSAVLFVGEKGMLLADPFKWKLLPEAAFPGYDPPKPPYPKASGFGWEPDSSRHYQEWITACKTGSPTSCHFGYAGPLTETVLLGNVAYRVGEKLHWNSKDLKALTCPNADPLIRREYRKGWSLS